MQSDAHKADISHILKQYGQVGIIENLNRADAKFLDITEFTDFADAMRQAKMAEMDFMKLPSKVREIFNHSAEEWLDTAHDQDKRDALVEAGIIEGPPKVVETKKEPAGETPAEPAEGENVTDGGEPPPE